MKNTFYTELTTLSIKELIVKYSYTEDFFISLAMTDFNCNLNIIDYVNSVDDTKLEHICLSREKIIEDFLLYMENIQKLILNDKNKINSITVIGGYNKLGEKEDVTLILKPGEIVSIVGPTGSGKSRLLADIECLAQNDTPSGRQILINNEIPDDNKRFSIENKLVAELSQNMNFVMDLSVSEFIVMHAESRLIDNIEKVEKAIIDCANELAGEQFCSDVPITQLSGGQSRALMIADTALLSKSPIVLIDEIENAGVDRKKALELLVKKEKIVLMSTHDPILALTAHRRVVIKNGGINKIIETTDVEKNNLKTLNVFDDKIINLRNMIRTGKQIDFDINVYLK